MDYELTTLGNIAYNSTYLNAVGSGDPWNDLFLCHTENKLTLDKVCGGPYHCQPPQHDGDGCNLTTGDSCCN